VKRPPYGSLGLPAGPVVGVPVEIVVPVTGPIVVVGFPVGTTIGDGSLPPLLGAGVAAETVKEGMLHSASQQYLPFGQSAGLPLGHCVSGLQFSSASKYELPQNVMSIRLPIGGPVMDSGVATVPSSMSAMLQPTDQQYPPFGQSVGLPLGQCLSALQLSSAS
jgi:hypothetical protein